MAIKTHKRGSEELLAPNFRAREFDCQGRGCCTETPIDEKLVAFLQQIRDHFGKPVYVTAYRCRTHNAKVANAASNSYHLYGQAADISPVHTERSYSPSHRLPNCPPGTK